VLRQVAIVGWSGAGELADLERTVSNKLSLGKGGLRRVARALVVQTPDPVGVARRLESLPGVEWVAVGYRFRGMEGYLEALKVLSTRYLRRGNRFRIVASMSDPAASGDYVLAGSSAVLSSIGGTKVSERRPQVSFRVSADAGAGALGAEIRGGPGGLPTGGERVACMVSGGYHSSAMAWMAALSGFSIRLVHSRSDDGALTRVAKLYSELSRRMDPTGLELLVLEGGEGRSGRLGAWLREEGDPVLAGVTQGRAAAAVRVAKRFPGLLFPLLLVQEREIARISRSLGVKDSSGPEGVLERLGGRGGYSAKRFGGREADLNEVVDSILRR
jgi:hypothetical protein